MKAKILIVAMAAAIGFSPVAKADDLISEKDLGGKFSANVALTSEYFYRGLSQSGKGNPAIQGGIDFAHNSGLYIGNWNSSINFGGNIESDFYGGWAGELGSSKVTLNVGALLYHYPSAANTSKLDYWEGYAGLSKNFGFASGMVKFSYSPDWTGTTDSSGQYLEAGLDIPAGKYFTVNLHAGHQWFSDNSTTTGTSTDDYMEYIAGVSVGLAGFTVKVAYVDNDLPNSQSADMGRFVATVSRSFKASGRADNRSARHLKRRPPVHSGGRFSLCRKPR
jgi:uncharacterized protein (TIGR02001 family)